MLEIVNLKVSREGKEILKGVDLCVKSGELSVLMGPNGSGKSTLAMSLMGSPNCEIFDGKILLNGKNILKESPDKRAKEGLFMSFQYPVEVPGVTMRSFLRVAYKELGFDVAAFNRDLDEALNALDLDKSFMGRFLNGGFSGGEKKKSEILQLLLFKPKYAVLDETDSGLDVSALKIAASSLQKAMLANKNMGVLLITHYQRVLKYLDVDSVHILMDGRIVKSGDKNLAFEIEEEGYGRL